MCLKLLRQQRRIRITTTCSDASYIPKVSGAGETLQSEGSEYQLMHNGVKIIRGCYHGEWMTELIRKLRGHHEPQEERVFYEVLKTIPSGATMIELGSFWSYYSMWFHEVVHNAVNYMIEPNPEKLEIGKRNFEINKMRGTFTGAFVSRESKESSLFRDWDGQEYNKPQVCIDDYIAQNGTPFVHILHSDIQGTEYNMLLGCKKSIGDKRIGYFFISTHGKSQHKKCLKFFNEHQFNIVAFHSEAESFSEDGLIVARASYFAGIGVVKISKRKSFCGL